MAVLSVKAIRGRVLDHLAATLGPDAGAPGGAWSPSRHSFEGMTREAVRDAADVAHQSYAVATPSTMWAVGRQGRGRPQHTATKVHVRYLYRLRVEDYDGDYADALDAEIRLLHAVLSTPSDPQLAVQLDDGVSRRTLDAGTGPYLLGELHFVVHHPTALQ